MSRRFCRALLFAVSIAACPVPAADATPPAGATRGEGSGVSPVGAGGTAAATTPAAKPSAGTAPRAAGAGRWSPPPSSPEVTAERTLRFRLVAPEARAIVVKGQWGGPPTALTKDAAGLWTATVGPVAPGIFEYSFVIDGAEVVDPGNPIVKPQRGARVSLVEVPSVPPAATTPGQTPHGTLHVHVYDAKALGRPRRVHVYTPPGYESRSGAGAAAKLPVLYLLHGYSDNDGAWSVSGRAHVLLDNLLAAGKARPMIVVMTDGHPLPYEGRSGDRNEYFRENVEAFRRDLLEEVVPLVERTYRARKDGEGRAIVGLSMGGMQALTIGLGAPERFGWIGAFSAVAPAPDTLDLDPKRLAKLRWLWIGCGEEDGLRGTNETLVAALGARGIPHEWHLTPGGHSWPVWRGYLADVLPGLFVSRPRAR